MKSKMLPWQLALSSDHWKLLEQVGLSPSHFFSLSARYWQLFYCIPGHFKKIVLTT